MSYKIIFGYCNIHKDEQEVNEIGENDEEIEAKTFKMITT